MNSTLTTNLLPASDPPPARSKVVLAAVLFEGGLAAIALAGGWLTGHSVLAEVRLDLRDALVGLAATVPLIVALLAVVRVPWRPLRRLVALIEEVVVPLFERCRTLDFALIALVAGVGEELLFRGLVQGWLDTHWGTPAALLLASLLFGAAHAVTWTYAVYATLVGVYLGWLWLATGNLLVPAIVHAAYDFVALVYLARRGRPQEREQLDD